MPYAAMSMVVDEGVGEIVGAIRELGELENTLIVYLSDNGPDGFHSYIGATPLTGAKRFLSTDYRLQRIVHRGKA